MAHFGSGVEYGLHCLLYLVMPPGGAALSVRNMAEYQGVSPSYVAKLFTRLQKAGLVSAEEGVRGGFRLARPADTITVLDVADALEGRKPLFECRDIRANCVLYADGPPDWATRGTCDIHALMIEAEESMRDILRRRTLAELAARVVRKVPRGALAASADWFRTRIDERAGATGRKTAKA